jgi:hypothetical protein
MISPSVPELAAGVLVGSFRTFGERGPVYQVLRQTNADTLRIVVVESGEELDDPVAQAAADPEAR